MTMLSLANIDNVAFSNLWQCWVW